MNIKQELTLLQKIEYILEQDLIYFREGIRLELMLMNAAQYPCDKILMQQLPAIYSSIIELELASRYNPESCKLELINDYLETKILNAIETVYAYLLYFKKQANNF